MNMGELAALAAQKAALAGHQNSQNDYSPLADDSPDLKTPTAEDIISVPEQKVKKLNKLDHFKRWEKTYLYLLNVIAYVLYVLYCFFQRFRIFCYFWTYFLFYEKGYRSEKQQWMFLQKYLTNIFVTF